MNIRQQDSSMNCSWTFTSTSITAAHCISPHIISQAACSWYQDYLYSVIALDPGGFPPPHHEAASGPHETSWGCRNQVSLQRTQWDLIRQQLHPIPTHFHWFSTFCIRFCKNHNEVWLRSHSGLNEVSMRSQSRSHLDTNVGKYFSKWGLIFQMRPHFRVSMRPEWDLMRSHEILENPGKISRIAL